MVTGDTRRMPYAVGTFASRAAVMSGSAIHLAALRAREKALRIAADALEAADDDLEIVDGVVSVRGHRTPRSTSAPSPCSPTRCATPSTRRPRRPRSSPSATPGKPPVAEDDEPGLEGTRLLQPRALDVRLGHARGDRGDRPRHRRDHDPEVRRRPRLRPLINPMIVEGQIHGGVAQGVGGALLRADGVRRVRAAAQRVVHGLPDALRHRGARPDRHRPPRDAVAAEPARHQGRRRGRRDPVGRGVRLGDRGRRGLRDHRDADLAVRPVRAARGPIVEPVASSPWSTARAEPRSSLEESHR